MNWLFITQHNYRHIHYYHLSFNTNSSYLACDVLTYTLQYMSVYVSVLYKCFISFYDSLPGKLHRWVALSIHSIEYYWIDKCHISIAGSALTHIIPSACYYLHTERCSLDFDFEETLIVLDGSVEKRDTSDRPWSNCANDGIQGAVLTLIITHTETLVRNMV